MGGIDFKSAVMSLVLNIANIIILFIVLKALVYKPVKKYMKTRKDEVESQTEKAELFLSEAAAAKKQSDNEARKAIEAAEEQKRAIVATAEKQALDIIHEAVVEAEKIKDSAAVKATHIGEQMLEEMQEKIANLSLEIAQKVLEREISKSDNADIIDSFFTKVV